MRALAVVLALTALSSAAARADVPPPFSSQWPGTPRLSAPMVLQCFHPSARYLSFQRTSLFWNGAGAEGANDSEVDRIYFSGALTHHPYAMDVAVVWRKGMVRVILLTDTAVIPANDRCPLINWQG